ncbi:oxidoreductase [Rhizobium sp. Root708]|uniref:L,D-transpeptidase n=1 Tax=Rhizobium sp. Root708 TaxID=1736592 RepID=UPI0006F9A10E|nr:L,D-transpeptidase [Rhizobium sp. Root708]KRB62097.1 oxidoreductase [Rhizobium sp. Root708]
MCKYLVTRRGIIFGGMGMVLSSCVRSEDWHLSSAFRGDPDRSPRYRRQEVAYNGGEAPGTIVVNTSERFLYFVESGGRATRYGVAVGEEGLSFKGVASVGRKAEWPSWKPTEEMMQRKPRLIKYADGVPGGPLNPLGAAALYLYQGGQDTMFRVHGTNAPWSIGQAVSNGCVRMTNESIVDLYRRVPVGSKVIVI